MGLSLFLHVKVFYRKVDPLPNPWCSNLFAPDLILALQAFYKKKALRGAPFSRGT